MAKKLTDREIHSRYIETIVKRLVSLERQYGAKDTRAACSRFVARRSAEAKLKKEIAEREDELASLRKSARHR